MIVEDLHRALSSHPFFEGLGDNDVAVLSGCARNVRFAPGDLLLQEGAAASVFYLVRAGRVSLEIHAPGRPAQRVETVAPGDILGLSWMFPPSEVQLDARAQDPVLALALDGACLRGKMEADPVLGYAIAKRLLAMTVRRLESLRLQRIDVYGTG